MTSEYRLIITATFVNKADRDAAAANLTTQITTYNTNNPGKMKRADVTQDDYFIADANSTARVV